MNWKRAIGLDNLSEEYAFARGESTGYTSAKKIPDHWVPTTCGYCSVGCGIEIGVKDGRAIASRPFELHPVNRGKLCPKGLSEHYTIHAENRAKYPMLRKGGKLVRVGWNEALDVMVETLFEEVGLSFETVASKPTGDAYKLRALRIGLRLLDSANAVYQGASDSTSEGVRSV